MAKKPRDIKADIMPPEAAGPDRGETIGLMEPMLVSESSCHRTKLADLAVELAQTSAAFRASLPTGIEAALATLVRAMNCYYSNLIEGHNTHPVDIERALKNDYSGDLGKRNLQIEAKAHITVQAWIDAGGLDGKATTVDGILEIHKRFCELLPDELLMVENPATGEAIRLIPGTLRQRDVRVGRHEAVSPGSVRRCLNRYEQAYGKLGRVDAILATAAAHHRLLWIHPFLDGNGRVARLVSHAMLRQALDSGAIWSIARGLARNESSYKQHLAACDLHRRNDLDGRGTLSEEALAAFTQFVLELSIDQVKFMRELVQPDRLRTRILVWAEEQVRAGDLPPKTGLLLEAVLFRGELPRADTPALLGVGDRQARRITGKLIDDGILTTDGPKAPLRLAFPAKLAARWMPGLFPEQTT
jgi:Fic family protein